MLDMIMFTRVDWAFSPFATTFLAISCSVIIPITDSPSTTIRELILLFAIFWAHSYMVSFGDETMTLFAITSPTLYLPSIFF